MKNNTFPQEKFSNYPIEFKFFGVAGEELDSKIESDNNAESFSPDPSIADI